MNVELDGIVHEHGGMTYLGMETSRCRDAHYYLTNLVYSLQDVTTGPEVPLARVVERPINCLNCIGEISEPSE